MPLPAGWRYLNEDEALSQREKGNPDVRHTIVEDSTGTLANTVQSGIDVTTDKEKSGLRRGAEFVGRQAANVALPLLVGRGAGALMGAALTSPTAPATAGAGPIIGGIAGSLVGGVGTGIAQNALLNRYAERHPSGSVADFVRSSEADREQHPLISQAVQLATGGPIAGGGKLGIELTKRGLKQAGAQAALQGGIEAGSEAAFEHRIDPARVGISTLFGAGASRPIESVRNLERKLLSTARVPERFREALAPALPLRGAEIKTDLLGKEGMQREKEANILKAANEKNAEELTRMQNRQGVQQATEELANPPLANKSAAESAEVIAGRSSEVKGVNDEIKAFRAMEKQRDKLVELIDQSPELTSDPTMRDLVMNLDKNILQRRTDLLKRGQGKLLYGEIEPAPAKIPVEGTEAAPIETTTVTPLESRMGNIPSETPPGETPAPTMTMAKSKETPSVEKLKVGDEVEYQGMKGTVTGFTAGSDGRVKPRIQFKPGEAIKKKVTPVPERAETINAQVGKLGKGLVRAVLITPGEAMPKVIPPGHVVTETSQGSVIHSSEINPGAVESAAAQDKLGILLGHATETHPVGANEAVAIVNPKGVEVKGAAVSPETKAAEVAALSKQLEPGEKIVSTTPKKLLGARLASSGGESSEQALGIKPQGALGKSLRAISKAVRPGLSRIASNLGDTGKYFKKKYEQMDIEARQYIEPKIQAFNEGIGNILSRRQKAKVEQFLDERLDTGSSNVKLTPEEQQGAEIHDLLQHVMFVDRSGNDSPLVRTATGLRPPIKVPNYVNRSTPNKYFMDTIRNGTPEQKEVVRRLYVEHLKKVAGMSEADANKQFNDFTTIASGAGAPFVEYAQLRLPEGFGLPKELRLGPLEALQRQIVKQGKDLSWHRNIESDPLLGQELGYPENGRGVKFDDSKPRTLGSNEDVRAAMQDYVGSVDPGSRKFDLIDRLAKTFQVQTVSQIVNILQTGTQVGRFLRPNDINPLSENLNPIYAGLKAMFSKSAQKAAIKRGGVRASRNIDYTAAEDTNDLLNGAIDVVQTLTGTEGLEKVHRTAYDAFAKAVSNNRLRNNDVEFFEQWGPANWREWNAEKLTDYTTTQLVDSMAGSYNAKEQPNFLLRGKHGAVKPLLSLARWSVGQGNRFIDEVYKPALKGNIGPLIGSLAGGVLSTEAINWFKEELTKSKPRELSWEEYLNLKGKDTAYTLLAKANTAGFAGILGNLAFQTQAAQHGESPMGFQNPGIAMVTETLQRLQQFANAVQNNEVSFSEGFPTLIKQLMEDRIQVARILLQRKPDQGQREEQVARRVGYLPPHPLDLGGRHLVNPFGATKMLQKEDVEGLRNLIQSRIGTGRTLPRVTSAVNDPRVYQFIADAQGSEAAQKALERDKALNQRRSGLLRQAAGR